MTDIQQAPASGAGTESERIISVRGTEYRRGPTGWFWRKQGNTPWLPIRHDGKWMLDEIARLQRDLAAAREDVRRMDFLGFQMAVMAGNGVRQTLNWTLFDDNRWSLREAIDAARRAAGGQT